MSNFTYTDVFVFTPFDDLQNICSEYLLLPSFTQTSAPLHMMQGSQLE